MIRTRFAPSPTGYLHVGGIRTALFAWLVARQANGKFILRIEDTDQARLVTGAEKHIQDSLEALGLNWDEGPFRQSDRRESYLKWAEKLIESGRAYADPYTAEEVQTFREQAQKSKKPFLYRNHRPDNPPKWDGKTALRFKSEPKPYKWHDEVMGDLSGGPEAVDDFILLKSGSTNLPTYNFAHIIDDYEMRISHVIRGQEFLPSVPNYLNLYDALGIEPPIFATMPHILNEQGNKKLSKRDGAKDVLDYIQEGFLPDALINFIASLGWNDGTEQEIFSRKELIQKFKLSQVQRSGARFDEQRLLWMNGLYIRSKSLDELQKDVSGYWPAVAKGSTEAYKKRVLGAVQERLKYLAELEDLTAFFFKEPEPVSVIKLFDSPPDKGLKNHSRQDILELLEASRKKLENIEFKPAELSTALNQLLEEQHTKPGTLFAAVRIAVTGSVASPAIADTMAVLGKDTCLDRLDLAISELS